MTLGVWGRIAFVGKTVGDHDSRKDQVNVEISVGFQMQIPSKHWIWEPGIEERGSGLMIDCQKVLTLLVFKAARLPENTKAEDVMTEEN